MEETAIRPHSEIPLGHKLFAVLLAAGVAAAGCAWLIEQSSRSASTAVLAYSAEAAQQIDPGISSATHPAVALAESMLNDQTIAKLAKQGKLASSDSAGQVGEFRSDLELTQPSALRLNIRYDAADPSQSMATANAVAHALADGIATLGTGAQAGQPTAPAPAAAPAPESAAAPAVAGHGQSSSSDAQAPGTQPAPAEASVPDHPLAEALTDLGAQLSATDRQIDRLGAGGVSSSGRNESSYIESSQQSLLRSKVREAQQTLKGLRTRYAKELTDANISARVNEIQQALDSILSGGHGNGFNAAGVSTAELSADRSELRQAIRIVNEETQRVQAAEAARTAAPEQSSASSSSGATQTAGGESPSAAAAVAAAPAPVAGQSAAPGVEEQNIPAAGSAGQSAQPPSTNPLSIVRLAAPRPRPPLWPAIAAGALCGLLYFGIAALAYRGSGSDDDSEVSPGPLRMITVADPIRIEEMVAEKPQPPPLEAGSRHRASFVFQPQPSENGAESAKKPIAQTEEPPAVVNSAAGAEGTAAEGGSPLSAAGSEPSSDVAASEQEGALDEIRPDDSPAEAAGSSDPVAERIRRSLANTTVAKMFESAERTDG